MVVVSEQKGMAMKMTIHTFTGPANFRIDAEMSFEELERYVRGAAKASNQPQIEFKEDKSEISVFLTGGSGSEGGSHVFFSPAHSYRGHMDWREADKARKLDAEADALFVSEIKRVLGDFKFYVEENNSTLQ